MNELTSCMLKHSKFNNLIKDVQQKQGQISLFGLADSQKAHMIYALTAYSDKSCIIVCSNTMQAKKMMQDLSFYGEIEVLYFPARELKYYTLEAESKEIENDRMKVISKIVTKERCIIVTTIDAMSQKMLPIEEYRFETLDFEVGKDIDLKDITTTLTKLGYERCQNVEGKGTFAIRGGILDIFGLKENVPYRIELFGDTIDSIRSFDLVSQRSTENVTTISFSQVKEFHFTTEKIGEVIQELKLLLEKQDIPDVLKETIEKDIEVLSKREETDILDKYFELFVKEPILFLDYVPDFTIFVDEPVKCIEKSKNIQYENHETMKLLAEKGHLYLPYAGSVSSFEQVEARFKYLVSVYLERINTDRILHAKRKEVIFSCREVNFFRHSMDILIQDIQKRKEHLILLVYPSATRVNQIQGFLKENKIEATKVESFKQIKGNGLFIMQGILSGGFEYDEFSLTVICEPVSYANVHKKEKKYKQNGFTINSFEDLEVGNYIVHETHGIGIYQGVETVETMNSVSDYIKIEYACHSNVYIPISQLDLVKKYICDDDMKPKISSLNSKEWKKIKSRAKEHVEEVAKELVVLYAQREIMKGHAFSKDTPWQKEFEESFPYELTDDQKYSTEKVKECMEKGTPMDMLLCGDVGYGKTEVAIRAAFKAVMDGKQVAYLVPTTVLSMQQYNTFASRMEKFGIHVEMLSRFKTAKEQQRIIHKLKMGEVDIVIGTHRLLSKDVEMKDLGLLIIDEEHRFGVKHKEAIKSIKKNIDVLSMTATPIPRTLHMSMIGVRDMATLTAPPLERIPVHTYVLEYDKNVIQQAIERELERDGQVFYLFNRVDQIEQITNEVRTLVPNARVEFAHGQMDPKEIEDIMYRFINHEIDVIVCTTILESGIDIPNANTIVIENADRLGLATLYQIRGRVGRSSRLAYAYITYRKNKLLSEIAEKRLKAIKDFTEFGSGFKIAMRDLELRGAGNILGKAQHGHMLAIGYDLYVNMLERAIEKEKTGMENEKENILEVKIDLPVSAFIPDSYISDMITKISMYHKISECENNEQMLEIIDELLDRFGDIPKDVDNLMKVVEIRNMCRTLNITKVYLLDNYLYFCSDHFKEKLKYFVHNKDVLMFTQFCLKGLLKQT